MTTAAQDTRPAALLLSPHPDDELLGCPAHLFALRDAGWRVVNLALSLGSDADGRDRRARELTLACERAGFELVLAPADIFVGTPEQRGADGDAAMRFVVDLALEIEARVLVAPSPHDDHPAHERVGRLAIAALRAGVARRLWLWGLWAELALPNSLCHYDESRLAEIEHALSAHSGEIVRNDYARLLRARAQAGAVLLPERVFGYGSTGLPQGAFAEAVCSLRIDRAGELLRDAPTVLDAHSLSRGEDWETAGSAQWFDGPSARQTSDPPAPLQ